MSEAIRTEAGSKTADTSQTVVVKKYANRRLYNTESSSYITLDNLADMVRLGRDFVVYDAKSGEDITRGVLTQIIVEEEGKQGQNLLPTAFLRQLIGFYGDQVQSLVPKYLEQALGAFGHQQEQMRAAMQKTMGNMGNLFPFGNMEEVSRQNMAMMERAMSFFTPFYRPADLGAPGSAPGGTQPGGADTAGEIASLRAEVAALRAQLAAKTK
jgi:polyhydroxyalkanoate synthesis repressor PhaR